MIKRLKHITSYIYPLTIEQCIGDVSPYLEVNIAKGKYVLDTANVNYSHGALHWVFDQTFQEFKLKDREVKNALILGFGAGSVASLLTEKYAVKCNMTGIEKDHIVIDLAYKYFDISRFNNLELVCEDAEKYVQACSKTFDLIVVDLYIDKQVPKCFHEVEFLKQLNRLLQPHGMLFFNKVVYNLKQKEELIELVSNMETILGSCLIYKLTKNNTDNHMVIHDKRTAFVDHSFVIKPGNDSFNKKQFVPSFN